LDLVLREKYIFVHGEVKGLTRRRTMPNRDFFLRMTATWNAAQIASVSRLRRGIIPNQYLKEIGSC